MKITTRFALLSLIIPTMAVSYTHLDVYKRQILYLVVVVELLLSKQTQLEQHILKQHIHKTFLLKDLILLISTMTEI